MMERPQNLALPDIQNLRKYFKLILLVLILLISIMNLLNIFTNKIDEKHLNQFIGKLINKTMYMK